MIDIVLVDDHRLFREGLRRLLSTDGRFRVVGEAGSGEEFLALLDRPGLLGSLDDAPLRPPADVSALGRLSAGSPSAFRPPRPLPLVFMDIDMPGMGGIEATRRALARWPRLRIVALSMHGEEEFYAPMMAAGAVGFLMKDSTLEQVVAAALSATGGGELAGNSPSAEASLGESNFSPLAPPLSGREREVLPLICAGLSTGQIADRLFISPRTVDKHRANILSKTGCPNTAALVVYAVKHGLITI